jgi:hypothetical protein
MTQGRAQARAQGKSGTENSRRGRDDRATSTSAPVDACDGQAPSARAWVAVGDLYHTYMTGLILTVASRRGGPAAAEWLFRVFRHQHHEKFLSSFGKLGLEGMPDPVACAAYHYLSNAVGGVGVEFMKESDAKAWVRFVPPRWIYPGAAICGVPSEVSRAMLRGWYAQNGVSLGNPKLGFVCTAQTTDGQHGLAGYFLEYGRDLAPEERLVFSPGELPPRFDASAAPQLPKDQWPPERRAKAARNYAMEYVRSSLPRLAEVFGPAEAAYLGRVTGQLIGAQGYLQSVAGLGTAAAGTASPGSENFGSANFGSANFGSAGSGSPDSAHAFGLWLAALATAEGDHAQIERQGEAIVLRRTGWRLMRGIDQLPSSVFEGWNGLFEGALSVHDRFLGLEVLQRPDWGDPVIEWRIRRRT